MTRDREQVANLVGKKLITKDLRVLSARPRDEPMLWVPDAVADAVGAARADVRERQSKLEAMSLGSMG